jgi:hypothetical protein
MPLPQGVQLQAAAVIHQTSQQSRQRWKLQWQRPGSLLITLRLTELFWRLI